MEICKVCGVELDEGFRVCPLCGTPVGEGGRREANERLVEELKPEGHKKHLLQQVLWQVTSVLLLSCILATLTIDLAIHGAVTWSLYPVSICVVVFFYASLMAVWRTRVAFQMVAAWAVSALFLLITDRFVAADWLSGLALPLLSAVTIIGLLLRFAVVRFRRKGLNVLASIFVALAVLCLAVDALVNLYLNGVIRLRWSVIVAACLLPVTAALLFTYFRTRDNADLQKIFHS